MLRPNHWLIIGNPENRRVSLFQQAMHQAGLAPAQVLPYQRWLEQPELLADYIGPATVVRLESPGENFEVEQRILALGGIEQALKLPNELGRIYYPRAWFAGYSRLLNSLLAQASHCLWFNHPTDVLTMFNKPASKQLLQPYTLASLPSFSGFDDFIAFVQQQPNPRFFIKLNYSSSASGVVAYEYHKTRALHLAYSSLELVNTQAETRYYNSLKIKKYTDLASIKQILDFLFQQGALVEPWLVKAQHQDWSYDLRIVAINQQRCHSLARLSRSPMTNLHLGNQRCSLDDLDLPAATYSQLDQLVAGCMSQFPHSLYAGLDVVLPRNGQAPVLLEANAFGDLLPNLLHQGQSTYLAEITALYQRQGDRLEH